MGLLLKTSTVFAAILLLLSSSNIQVYGVDRSNFKTCAESGFCTRLRNLHRDRSPYQLALDKLVIHNGSTVEVPVFKTSSSDGAYSMIISGLRDKTLRVQIVDFVVPRYQFNDSFPYGFQHQPLAVRKHSTGETVIAAEDGVKLVLYAAPMRLDVYAGEDRLVMSLNSQHMFEFERTKITTPPGDIGDPATTATAPIPTHAPSESKVEQQEHVAEAYNEAGQRIDGHPATGEGSTGAHADGEAAAHANEQHLDSENEVKKEGQQNFEERFKTHTDSQPKGHAALSLDVVFADCNTLYGIPEHADSFRLRDTRDTDPYRLYNLDVFEYEINSPMSLYGAVPLVIGHTTHSTVGLYFNNPSEMWIDVRYHENAESKSGQSGFAQAHMVAETGVFDLFIFAGPTMRDVVREFTSITGRPFMPQYFSIGYHQCRWNYNDEYDVHQVDGNFDAFDIPYDAIWLDIEHTDGKRYFTWDTQKFPHPLEMQKNLTDKGRKLVVISDPHIKKDDGYHVYSEGKKLGYFVKDRSSTNDYEGWCWPGASYYVDFFSPEARNWYADLCGIERYGGSSSDLYFWNDMNEPSVFNGPEVTMPKDAIHFGGLEHREVHNVYGIMHIQTVWDGLLRRSHGGVRPFILTRSFYAGIQRYSSVWTGDNTAEWSHLKASGPMLLSLSVCGVPFVGADVGGFFGNPDAELLVRWYQAAAYQPFMRGHAHLHTKRREPWLVDERTRLAIRDALLQRNEFAPYSYTLFYDAHRSGSPVMRPIVYEFPSDANHFSTDHLWMLGEALLVAPVTSAGLSSIEVSFPSNKIDEQQAIFYDKDTKQFFDGGSKHQISTPLEKIPVFYRGGTIVPTRQRYRRTLMAGLHDPLTLVVALDRTQKANGTLYMDDGFSYQFVHGKYLHMHFAFAEGKLHSRPWHLPSQDYVQEAQRVTVERIVFIGVLRKHVSAVELVSEGKSRQLPFVHDAEARVVTVKVASAKKNEVVPVMSEYLIHLK